MFGLHGEIATFAAVNEDAPNCGYYRDVAYPFECTRSILATGGRSLEQILGNEEQAAEVKRAARKLDVFKRKCGVTECLAECALKDFNPDASAAQLITHIESL